MALQGGGGISFDSQDEDDDSEMTFHELNLMAGWTSSPDDERQISVDPISLRESSSDAASFKSIRPEMPPPLPPLNPPHDHFLMTSFSLPGSACSSHRFTSKKTQTSRILNNDNMQRSKSCGEGRWCAPPDDILFALPPPPPRTNKEVDQASGCGALCLYLPGFGKGSKAAKSRREVVVGSSSRIGGGSVVISRAVSLERFECGSWASSAALNYMSEMDRGGGRNNNNSLYFDLPIELIRSSSGDDASSPVASAFLFDNSVVVVKGRSSKSRPSRFSGQDREDFNALLHAHNNNI